jgi:hypothetical protein
VILYEEGEIRRTTADFFCAHKSFVFDDKFLTENKELWHFLGVKIIVDAFFSSKARGDFQKF